MVTDLLEPETGRLDIQAVLMKGLVGFHQLWRVPGTNGYFNCVTK